MRFMVLVKANPQSEAGEMPSEELLTAMTKYNEELVNAGVMLAGEGLHPSSKGARVRFGAGQPAVIDGPFTETKEQLLGFYIVDCKSLEEAIEVARSLPSVRTIFEIRPVKLYFPGGNVSPILPPRAAEA
jgi:hypothetical protein